MARVTTVSSLSLKRARRPQPSRRVSIVAVWRDALSTFSAYSAAILMCALIGFAAPVIVGSWLNAYVKLSEYAHTLAVASSYEQPTLTILLVQAGMGVLALSFARGVITWIALHGEPSCKNAAACGSVSEACRIAFLRYPTLLVGSLLYGVLIAAGSIATSGLTKSLEFVPSKMGPFWPGPHRAHSDALRQLVWRGLNTLVPEPGPPFAQFAPDLRRAAERILFQASSKTIYVTAEYGSTYGVELVPESFKVHQTPSTEFWLVGLGGVATLFLAETLLRFRTVAALMPPGWTPRRFSLLTPLVASVSCGWKHLGMVVVHVWLVRLAIFGLTVALVEFPIAMVDHFIAPHAMRFTDSFEILPIMRFMAAGGAALVGAILLAFSTVYDARLYLALSGKTNPQTNLWQVTETSQAHSFIGKLVKGRSRDSAATRRASEPIR